MCSTTYIDVFELFHPLTNFFINEKHVLVSIHLFIYHKYTLLHKFVISKRLSLILISFFNFSISLIRRSNRDFKSLCNSRILFFLLQASSELYSGDVRAFIFSRSKNRTRSSDVDSVGSCSVVHRVFPLTSQFSRAIRNVACLIVYRSIFSIFIVLLSVLTVLYYVVFINPAVLIISQPFD